MIRRSLLALPLVVAAVLPASAGAVASATVTDPANDFNPSGTAPTKWPQRSVDISRAVFSSHVVGGTTFIQARIKVRNIIPRDRTEHQEFSFAAYRGTRWLQTGFNVSTRDGVTLTSGCAAVKFRFDRARDIATIRVPDTCIPGGNRNLRFEATAVYLQNGAPSSRAADRTNTLSPARNY